MGLHTFDFLQIPHRQRLPHRLHSIAGDLLLHQVQVVLECSHFPLLLLELELLLLLLQLLIFQSQVLRDDVQLVPRSVLLVALDEAAHLLLRALVLLLLLNILLVLVLLARLGALPLGLSDDDAVLLVVVDAEGSADGEQAI